ncbi:unnamed protein product [Clonostachys rosea f. rosea IK726]|uniref:Uncharacterized protein n=1 Tax=Clonostachys rosea f. rosea IK726 TaxID=1349383 RepID=A0ACA9UTM1_BIOOC|nr:unnamed protein product [Clonostachys rosea f. rosea IK726]
MSSLKDVLHNYKQRITTAISSSPAADGSAPAPRTGRTGWLENSTDDSVLSDFTHFLEKGTPKGDPPIFNKKELKTLKKIFTAHANSDNSWTQKSLESYLITQVPQDGDFKALLTTCLPSLWVLATYFSYWPFNTAVCTPITSLTFPAFTRAIAFLSGRHYLMFTAWGHQDSSFNRTTDQPVLEYIFRALATPRQGEQKFTSSTQRKDAQASLQRDILDVLSVAQPLRDRNTKALNRTELTPAADRLSPPAPPQLCDITIPATSVLVPLLDLSIALLQQTSEFDATPFPRTLKAKLETARTEVQGQEKVSFDRYTKLLDSEEWAENHNSVYTLYDGIAVLFNTFPNPESLKTGKTVNWVSGEEEPLYLGSLRSLGSTWT